MAKKQEPKEKKEKKKPVIEEDTEVLVRILGQDIKGSKNVYTGLAKIKGVSWSISPAKIASANALASL